LSDLTPMMRQYLRIKNDYPDCILFYRLGDFYEMFFEDALFASKVLSIALTARRSGENKKVPMCGIPYHAVDNYLPKLLKKGHKVAICEQVGDPKKAKGPMKREVIRVITPGTIIDANYLESNKNNYIVSIYNQDQYYGIAFCDLSTGEFRVTNIRGEDNLLDELTKLDPAECLIPEAFPKDFFRILPSRQFTVFKLKASYYHANRLLSLLIEGFSEKCVFTIGLHNNQAMLLAAGSLYKYLQDTVKGDLSHLDEIQAFDPSEFMVLDFATRRNLEIITNINGRKENTLLETLDKTVTAGGGRILRQWLEQPLKSISKIEKRLNLVEYFLDHTLTTIDLRNALKETYDMERLISKIVYGSANAKDMIALRKTLALIPMIKEIILKGKPTSELSNLTDKIDPLEELFVLLSEAIIDDPPLSIKEGNIIKNGYDDGVDQYRTAKNNGKRWIAAIEKQEKERTGIKSLKIGFNKVFGYYIEVTKANLDLVPQDYMRKQTLANCERYITPKLKEKESLILEAEEKLSSLEYELFQALRRKTISFAKKIKYNYYLIAQLDLLSTLAVIAEENDYIRPKLKEDTQLKLAAARHPVVEQKLGHLFVPNDLCIGGVDNKLMVITGPNMSGKSTYLRQNALLVLMAQMGSFIPAKSAEIGIVDRIFTRIGSSDNLAYGQSTFMVEMQEVSNIIKYSTDKSLIILDEVGRGTSTYDGVSLAWAISEYIYATINARTLFATHYHELTSLQEKYQGIKNFNIGVIEKGDEITFLHKLVEGSTDKSYGIQVAKLAGLPNEIITRAQELLIWLQDNTDIQIPKQMNDTQIQTPINVLENEIANLDLNRMTPIDALNILVEFQKRLSHKGE
jgi:DNA mismatch repair protein MutS